MWPIFFRCGARMLRLGCIIERITLLEPVGCSNDLLGINNTYMCEKKRTYGREIIIENTDYYRLFEEDQHQISAPSIRVMIRYVGLPLRGEESVADNLPQRAV